MSIISATCKSLLELRRAALSFAVAYVRPLCTKSSSSSSSAALNGKFIIMSLTISILKISILQFIKIITTAENEAEQHYKMIVVGSGCGGLALGSLFSRQLGRGNVAIIDSAKVGGSCIVVHCFYDAENPCFSKQSSFIN